MNKTPTIVKLLLAFVLVVSVILIKQPPMATAEIAWQEAPTNLIHIDVTYDLEPKPTAWEAIQRKSCAR